MSGQVARIEEAEGCYGGVLAERQIGTTWGYDALPSFYVLVPTCALLIIPLGYPMFYLLVSRSITFLFCRNTRLHAVYSDRHIPIHSHSDGSPRKRKSIQEK